MEEFSEDRVAAAAERAALINALQHEADAAVGPIMGPLMAEHPSFRAPQDAVSRIVAAAVAAVNADSPSWRRKRAAAPDADAARARRSAGDRARPVSSAGISRTPAAGGQPAAAASAIPSSVWPARSASRSGAARRRLTWPGLRKSAANASVSYAPVAARCAAAPSSLIVSARSRSVIPVSGSR